MSPSTEQQAIIAAFLAGADLAVQAGAGTGKSTTLAFIAAAAGNGHPTSKLGRVWPVMILQRTFAD